MGEWRKCKLSDIANLNMGQSPKSEFYNQDGMGLPFLQGNRTFGLKYPYFDTYCTEPKKIANAGDILFSVRAPVGDINIANTKICIGRGLSAISAKNRNNDFLYFLLHFLKNEIINNESGSVFGSISRTDLGNIKVLYPSLKEQKAIAEVLSSLDDKIDLLHRQNKTLEEMASALFRQWFIEEAKDEWEVVKLEDILTITSSKRIFYSEYVSSGVPFYRSKEIIELHNTGQTKGELFISEERYNEIIEKFGSLTAGDILLTSVGTLGIPYRVSKDDKFYFKDGNLTWFKNFKKLSSLIVFYWLKSDIGKEELNAITIGSTQAALTIKSLKNIQLSLPPKNIIDKLENQLIVIDDKFQANLKQIKTLENIRNTLLPKLMNGEVRVRYE